MLVYLDKDSGSNKWPIESQPICARKRTEKASSKFTKISNMAKCIYVE